MVYNPFAVESPEKLTLEEIAELFVTEYTEIEVVKQRKHTFVWGSRGSGKSMLFRFLEPRCQFVINGGCDNYFKNNEPFIGVYFPIKEGMLNKTEFNFMNDYYSMVISEHLMNVLIAECTINCIIEQFPQKYVNNSKCDIFAKNIIKLFDGIAINSSLIQVAKNNETANQGALDLLKKLFFEEGIRVMNFLKLCALRGSPAEYHGATSGYHDFLLPFMKEVRMLLDIPTLSIYLLIDDAGRLLPIQQKIINSWIANRDQNIMCIKASAVKEDYLTFRTKDEWLIDDIHDFTDVDVESIYTSGQTDYENKVALIAEKRLRLSDISTKSIKDFLPSDKEQDSRIKELKEVLANEWEKNNIGRKEDYINRYTNARLFQEIKQKKQQRNYAGYINLVHISSGVIRNFLEPCYLMFDKYVSKEEDIGKISCIPPSVQNEVIFNYSERMLNDFDQIMKELNPNECNLGIMLRTLVESLGRLFYNRLHNPDSREARVFSFTIKNESALLMDIRKVLALGVKYRYFQKRTYSSKEGGGREPWYIFNRRLCPVFKLDPTGFEGRISLTAELVMIACNNTDEFVKKRMKIKDDANQMTLFDSETEGGEYSNEN